MIILAAQKVVPDPEQEADLSDAMIDDIDDKAKKRC